MFREDGDPVKSCFHAAQWFPLSINPFVNLAMVLRLGMEKSLGVVVKGLKLVNHMYVHNSESWGSCSQVVSRNEKEKEYHLKMYQEFVKLSPEFVDIVKCLGKQHKAIKTFLKKVHICVITTGITTDNIGFTLSFLLLQVTHILKILAVSRLQALCT